MALERHQRYVAVTASVFFARLSGPLVVSKLSPRDVVFVFEGLALLVSRSSESTGGQLQAAAFQPDALASYEIVYR